jgi:DNA repair exonuclease SbcCD ATPase subunit
MWVCPNCETANNSRKRKCAVCDSEKPFSNENPNSPSILKSKIQELEEQILILNQEQFSLNQSKEALSSELNRVKYALTTSNNEKDNLKKQLEKITSDKTSVEYKLKQITSLSSLLTSTKTELESQVTNLQAEVEKLKQDDNTGCLGIIIIVFIIGLFIGVYEVRNLRSQTEQLQNEKQEIESKLQSISSEVPVITSMLENQVAALQNKLKRISNEIPLVITSIDFENTAEANNYKQNFNYYKVQYISPRLKIIPISDSWSGKISVKYFEPNGELNTNPTTSPSGFTFDNEINIHSTQEYIYLPGWGSDSGSTYEVGTHAAEIWYNGKIIGKQAFTVSY